MIQSRIISESNESRRIILFTFISVLLGSWLRLRYAFDFEWKYDEQWMFNFSQATIANGGPFPWIGMLSSMGWPNPGASTWVFVALASWLKDPVTLNTGVEWLNVITLWVWFCFIFFRKMEGKNVWFFGLALWSVCPLAVLWSRKIWAQSVLPPFVLFTYLCFYFRQNRGAALFCGALGMFIGQIHMSGFLFFPVLAGLFFKKSSRKNFYSFLLGAALSFVLMVPWILHVLSIERPLQQRHWLDFTTAFRFLKQIWRTTFGVNLKYSLEVHLDDFFVFNKPFGIGAWGFPKVIHFSLIVIGFVTLFKSVSTFLKSANTSSGFKSWFQTETSQWGIAVILCYLMVFFFFGIPVFEHYLIILFPFAFFWIVLSWRNHQNFIWIIVALMCAQTFLFQEYIHENGGAPRGDYGLTFERSSK